MPCCPTCACAAQSFECLAVLDPARFGNFAAWCRLDDSTELNRHLRRTVLERSRIGLASPPAAPPPAAIPSPSPPAIPLAGDLVAALTHRIGADRAAQWVARKLGASGCGCGDRRAALNRADAAARRYLQRFAPK